jgi:DMSO reductase anchor subunit
MYKRQGQPGMKLTAIMLFFTFGLAMLCQLCPSAKRDEIFAATVAYCAVLVLFVSQNNGSNNGDSPPAA